MVISVEHGLQKTALIILSLLFLFLGIYPFVKNYVSLSFFNESYIPIAITIIAVIQLIMVIKMKRPRVY